MDIEQILTLTKTYEALTPERILLSGEIKEPTLRRAVATQVGIQSNLKAKLPSWAKQGVYIPHSLNLEQASSEATAKYKQRFVSPQDTLLDLTGGMGVDFWAMASRAERSIYVESQQELCEATRYNLSKLLPKQQALCLCLDSMEHLEGLLQSHRPSLVYLDPARRAGRQNEQRVYAIEDCSPSLYEVLERLSSLSQEQDLIPPRLLVKLSPMLDVSYCLRELPQTESVHIVAHRGEVKELLLSIDLNAPTIPLDSIAIHAVDLLASGKEQCFSGSLSAERKTCPIAERLGAYLYEPNGAVMKQGLYQQLGSRFGLEKLHPHSQLYTSDIYHTDFPGRILRIIEMIPYQSRIIKEVSKRISGAQITCRNFGLSPTELRQRLKLPERSDATIVATRLYDGSRVLLYCTRE